jgi:hypothetical protein
MDNKHIRTVWQFSEYENLLENPVVDGRHFVCNKYRHGTRSAKQRLCTPHTTRFYDLIDLVMQLVRAAVTASLDVEQFVRTMTEDDSHAITSKKALDRLKKRDGELKIFIKRAFEQNALGKIDEVRFRNSTAIIRVNRKT